MDRDIDVDIVDNSEFSCQEGSNKYENFLCPLYKLLFKYPAKIMRVILQFGDLYFFIEILSFTIELFLILLTSTARFHIAWIVFLFLGFLLFSFLFGNVLTIQLWEFIQFRWLKNMNPFQTFFNLTRTTVENKTLEKFDMGANLVIGIFFYFYLAFWFSGSEHFEFLNYIVIFVLPCAKYTLLYLVFYFIHSIISIFNHDGRNNIHYNDPFVEAMKMPKDGVFFLFHKICKCCNYINNNNISKKQLAFIIIKELAIAFAIVYLVFLEVYFRINFKYMIIPYIIWLVNSTISLAIDMPIWILNVFNRWDCRNIIEADKGINKDIREKNEFRGFKYANSICTFILPLLIIGYIILLARNQNSTFEPINRQTLWNGELSHIYDNYKEDIKMMSPLCNTEIYHLNLVQIGAIAAATYHNDTELTQQYFRNSFFRDEELIITSMDYAYKNEKDQLKYDNHPVVLRVDIDNKKSSRDLTIFAVRGSTTSIDWWLDIEIFLSSALLSMARWIPIFGSFESKASKLVSNFITLPLSHLAPATLTYDYTQDMFKAVDYFYNDPRNRERTVLFTGHSLGGGLSKILANKFANQSVSFSGPGISPIEDKFEHDNYDKYFKAKFIDIIPDNDFVPRFEISGGTRFRVLCQQNGVECHNIWRTICQIGLSCNLEYFTGDFCRGKYGKNEYEEMIDLALGKD